MISGTGVGRRRDTPSFLLVTRSNFQYILQALVIPEIILIFLAPRTTEAASQVGREAPNLGCLPPSSSRLVLGLRK